MDARKGGWAVIDPKVRKVGFVTASDHVRSALDAITTEEVMPSISVMSLTRNTLFPVMIPPPRHFVEAAAWGVPVPVPLLPHRRPSNNLPLGSYKVWNYLLSTSLLASPSSRTESVPSIEFSEEPSPRWVAKTVSASVGGDEKMDDFVQHSASLPTASFPNTGN